MFACIECNTKIDKIRYYCIQCKACSNCCGCELFGFVKNKFKFHAAKETEKKNNASGRFIAAEIEVAGLAKSSNDYTKLGRTLEKWKCSSVTDGSLPYSGFEITTSPANGDLFINQINEITTELKTLDAIITNECGLHIHIDARDYNFYDIAKLVKLYAAIEPVFFAMVPEHRRKSKYCLPCGSIYKKTLDQDNANFLTTKSQVVMNTYNSYDSHSNRKSKYNNARYNALNLHSWFYRGTIEFRLMEGSIDPAYITSWGMIWAKMLDYILQADTKDINKIVNMHKKSGGVSSNMIARMMPDDKLLIKFVADQMNKNALKTKKKKNTRKG